MSSALTGRFLFIVLPGSPQWDIDKEKVSLSLSSDADFFHLEAQRKHLRNLRAPKQRPGKPRSISCFLPMNINFIFTKSMEYRVHGILQARVLEWVAFPFSSLPAEPQGKPKGSFNVPNLTYSSSFKNRRLVSLAAVGLCCCVRAFSSGGEWGLFFAVVCSFSLQWLLLLQSMSSSHVGLEVAALGL